MARATHDVDPVVPQGGRPARARGRQAVGPGTAGGAATDAPAETAGPAGSAEAIAARADAAFATAAALKARAGDAAAAAMEALRFTGEGTRGLTFERRWTRPGVHPYDEIAWETRTAAIGNESGKLVFEQKDVEVPASWSQLATNVVVSKYFRGHLNTPERETSVRQLIDRVVLSIAAWAETQRYFATPEDLATFQAELTHLLVHQKMSFNSPVWFNVGIEAKPQCSACFINSVQDSMSSIMDLAKTEAMLFKFGSGAGSNLSPIRSSREKMAGGGTASGPVSFMKGYDSFAGVVKSGGKTRRAAKMVILDAGHPDILDFVDSKKLEEQKAWALIEQGYDPSFTGEAYGSVFFQNANHSVRVTDEFMRAVEDDGDWTTHAVVGGAPMDTHRARDIFRRMAEAAHVCGDPGIQYDTTINDWNPVSSSDRQYATNPCVTGDTLVATDQGWRSIESMVGERANVIGSDGVAHPVDRIFPTGTKPVFELKTRAGYRVRITADHKVATQRGDVAVRDLTPDDRIPLQGPGFGRSSIAPRLAEAIGLAVGDGCLTWASEGRGERPMIILTMHRDEAAVLDAVVGEINQQKHLRKAVGSVGRNDGVHVSSGATGSRLAFASRPVIEQFMQYAVLDEGGEQKRLKPAVHGLDRASIAGLLRGLFTADGTVVDSGEKSQYVGLDSTSLELLVQVQRLLLAFGVKAKLYENRRGGHFEAMLPDGRGGMKTYPVREMHSLRITRTSRRAFEREIGFMAESPKAAALAALNATVGTYREEMTDPVASVTRLGEEDVFDLTERVTSHFVANGLVIHNCSEFSFLNDTSCNLASVNLMKFVGEDGEIDVEAYRHACRVTITAQEILVDNASYPTPKIEENSHRFRPLGLGYANLGALLMSRGLAYDSPEGQAYAAALTSVMTAEAYRQSAVIARDHGGPFVEFEKNRAPFMAVIAKHRAAATEIPAEGVPAGLAAAARSLWDETYALGEQHGYRNAQTTLLAPTGCLVGDSLVLTDRGLVRLRGLGNPDGEKWQDLDLRVATDDGPREATRFYVNGAEPVVTVETSRGYRIQGTTTHRIRVVDPNGDWQWRRFADLRAGDRVPMTLGGMVGDPREVPLPPVPEAYWTSDHRTFVPRYLNADLAELVGYFMGDGSLHARGLRFCVTGGDDDVVARITDLGRRLFGLDAAVSPKAGYTEVALNSVRLALWWEACGFAKHAPSGEHRGKGYEAHIPDAVLYSNDATVYRAFVRGLFEADGSASNGYASWSTVSDRFSRDVQALLLALGFVTTRKVDQPVRGHKGANPVHVLRLLNASAGGRFLAEISFISDRKRTALALAGHAQAARYDLVPVSRQAVDRLAPGNDHLRKTMLLSLARTGLVSRRSATALLERTADPDLAQALGYFYDEIASATLGEEQLTYDLSVPANVTYVANGFVSHNTIAFMMDCDTTGIEPDIALIKYKKLVGEGYLKIVNNTVPGALRQLGYTPTQVEEIVAYVDERETIEGAPGLAPDHLAVFDCAFKPRNGVRSIAPMGHVRMMAAVQPFLSGAISKTVNMPEAATVEEIEQIYLEGWKLGLKAIAIYRDNSKRSQPLSTSRLKSDDEATAASQVVEELRSQLAVAQAEAVKPHRRRLPAERSAVTHKFEISGHEGYITVGLYPDGQPGEIFLRMAKEGSTVSGLMDTVATAISLALQYGVPLRDLVNKFAHVRFEPSGFTGNSEIPIAKSSVDYIFRWLGSRFLGADERAALGIQDRGNIVPAAPFALGAGPAYAPQAEEGPLAIDEAIEPPAPTATATATATARGSSPATGKAGPSAAQNSSPAAASARLDLPVVESAGKGHANGNGSTTANGKGSAAGALAASLGAERTAFTIQEDAPSCMDCGSIMVRNGSCYKCLNCGSTSGCS
jgi:ribonucleoside-diphosphate reductase alpha chain